MPSPISHRIPRIRPVSPAPFGAPVRILAALWIVATAHAQDTSPDPVEVSPLRFEAGADSASGFERVPPSWSGLDFTNRIALERYTTNQVYLNGSGVAAGDYDRDGLCDLYLCGLDTGNALFRNLGGWRFTNVTVRAGVACSGLDSTGAAFADLDGDGWADLVVNTIGRGTRLFRNRRDGTFEPHPTTPVLNPGKAGMSLALADTDLDGDLDLYITNYRSRMLMDEPGTFFQFRTENGRTVIDSVDGRSADAPDLRDRFRLNALGGIDEFGEPDVLYRNESGTGFTPLSWDDGRFESTDGSPLAGPVFGWGLSAMFRDINRDGLPDLYVCNDFQTADVFWINLGSGRFRALGSDVLRRVSYFSMGVDFGDLDRNGLDDLLVLDMLSRSHRQRMNTEPNRRADAQDTTSPEAQPAYSMNTLFAQVDPMVFSEIAQFSGLAASEWSWAAAFLDVDLDGWEDVLITNGTLRDGRNLDVSRELARLRTERRLGNAAMFRARNRFPRRDTPNLAFRNLGGLRFADATAAWGFDAPAVSHGLALADLDNDGDLDVVVNNLNQEAFAWRNTSTAPRIAVRLSGNPPNTAGIGARITVRSGRLPAQSQEIIAGGRYLSSDQPGRTFAADPDGTSHTIEVRWPKGAVSLVRAQPNHLHDIHQPTNDTNDTNDTGTARPLFVEVSERLPDPGPKPESPGASVRPAPDGSAWQVDPTPHAAAWIDFDRDGWTDLILGGRRNERLTALRNLGGTAFEPLRSDALDVRLPHDIAGLIPLRPSPEQAFCLAAFSQGGSEPARASFAIANPGTRNLTLFNLGDARSVASLAGADVDGDGDVDLFAGGGTTPDTFPKAAASVLYTLGPGGYQPSAEHIDTFGSIGEAASALFSDVDRDGDPDLLVAGRFTPIRLFLNERGRFTDVTGTWDLGDSIGLWRGLAAGDFNGDRLPDFIATNYGLNSPERLYSPRGVRLLVVTPKGRSGSVRIDVVHDPARDHWVPLRMRTDLARSLPWLNSDVPDDDTYGSLSIDGQLQDRVSGTELFEARELRSMVFLNRGGRFEAIPLPAPAQWTPGFGIAVADFDGDGYQDAFLAQNAFMTPPDVPRFDAGHGCLLIGDGEGGFKRLPPSRAGIRIGGEQRAVVGTDFDRDGRPDLLVTGPEEGGGTRLFRGDTMPAALRLRVTGPASNPDAVGVSGWVEYEQGPGHLFEIRAGGVWQGHGDPVLLLPRRHRRLGAAENIVLRSAAGSERRLPFPEGPEFTTPSPRP